MRKVQVIFIVWLILAIIIYVLNGSKAAAAMFIVAALYCALAAVMVFLSGRKMSVRISTAKETRKNEPVEITVAASSNSRIPIPTCRPRLTCVNKLTKEEFTGFCMGNVLKYSSRWRKKDGLQDLKKAKVYLEWAIENEEENA